MKTPILIFATILSLALVACGHNTANQEFKYEEATLSSGVLAETENSQAAEKQLIDRLQAIINEFDSVSDTAISITTSEETGKAIVVSITTETNKSLTDEQKEGIVNIIADSCGDVEADNIHVAEN